MITVKTFNLSGIDAAPIEIEVNITGSFPTMEIYGMPEASMRETRVRVRSAIREAGFLFPDRRIAINISPPISAPVAPMYDLPIALAILQASLQLAPGLLDGVYAIGELSLSGTLRPVRGVLPMAGEALKVGVKHFVCPTANAAEAAAIYGLPILHGHSLKDVVSKLASSPPDVPDVGSHDLEPLGRQPCWSDVRGQAVAKRALEIAAAGGHNIMLLGCPGTGKTMLARRLPTIMPMMTKDEVIETSKIHSVAGLLPQGRSLSMQRPFRAPHHTGSAVSLIGGGGTPRPGEVSLAHNGVLFVDEVPEWPRQVLDCLRPPTIDRKVSIARARKVVTFPSNFLLVASRNNCPCGWENSVLHQCNCSKEAKARFLERISGPFLDLLQMQVELEPIPPRLMSNMAVGETSDVVRERVAKAREIQENRYGFINASAAAPVAHTNATAPIALIERLGLCGDEVNNFILQAQMYLGVRPAARDNIVRVARTIADLDGVVFIEKAHVQEAIGYVQ